MIGTTISHYRILGQIGEGGMGVVYVAEDTRLGRRVAVKIPHAGRDEQQYRARFLREARAVSALSHPNIAAVFDYGETDDGAPFIVMELVTGQTLGDLLLGHGLTLLRAVEIIRQVAEALAEAHRRGIVHRDVKPSNVIINDRGEVKVLDFGLAKHFDNGGGGGDHQSLLATRSDVIIGTPLYLSPEQARGSAVDGRSDLFALGALLYECVAGRPAFSGASVIEIGAQVLHFDPPPPSQLNSRVPPELDRVTLRALAKRPEDRYQTASEMAEDLARAGSRLSAEDTTRTRRLTTDAHIARPSALNTIAERLRRPSFSPLALAAALAVVFAGVWAYAYLRAPSPHRPTEEAARLYAQGVEAMRAGAYFRASGFFREAAEADDHFALAHARLGEAFVEMDYLDRATGALLRAQQLAADAPLEERDALYLDAVTATVRRDHAEAVRVYQRIAQLAPDAPHAHVDLGRAREKNNETSKAEESYTKATELDPAYAAAYLRLGTVQARLRNVAGMNAAFERAGQLYRESRNPEGEAEVHLQRGRVYVDGKKTAEAARELTQALELAREARNPRQEVEALFQLSNTVTGLEEARALTDRGVGLAQSAGMYDQAAAGHIGLGVLYINHNDYARAEQHLRRALDYARDHKVRRLQARALFNLGSLYSKQNRPDDAISHIEQARDFYEQGGYRGEAHSAAMIVGRTQRQKGDYEGALRTFDVLLQRAEQSREPAQIAAIRYERGTVLLFHERHPQALEQFDEALKVYRTLNQSALVAFAQVNRANALWRLGRYDEARGALDEAARIASDPAAPNRDVMTSVRVTEAQATLSQRRHAEAAAAARAAREAAEALGAQARHLAAEAHHTHGLALASSGAAARGRQLCEEALRAAGEMQNPWYAPNARLALAEALLAAGEARRARDEALTAHEAFARQGRAESEWRALALAARAAAAGGDAAEARELAARASASLSALEQSWGAAATPYLTRPDVQQLRKGLGGEAAAAAR